MADPDEIVLVPVPVCFLGPVYGLLSDLMFAEQKPDLANPDMSFAESLGMTFPFGDLFAPAVPVNQLPVVD